MGGGKITQGIIDKLLIGVAVLALLSIGALILCNKISKERVVVELDSRQKSNKRKNKCE